MTPRIACELRAHARLPAVLTTMSAIPDMLSCGVYTHRPPPPILAHLRRTGPPHRAFAPFRPDYLPHPLHHLHKPIQRPLQLPRQRSHQPHRIPRIRVRVSGGRHQLASGPDGYDDVERPACPGVSCRIRRTPQHRHDRLFVAFDFPGHGLGAPGPGCLPCPTRQDGFERSGSTDGLRPYHSLNSACSPSDSSRCPGPPAPPKGNPPEKQIPQDPAGICRGCPSPAGDLPPPLPAPSAAMPSSSHSNRLISPM